MRREPDGTRVRENVRQAGYSKRLGFGRLVRFHDLRHTCASHLIMGTWGVQWSLSEIAAFLGHSDTEVTERYAHLSPDYLHGKAARTSPRGTELLSHATPPDDGKLLARLGRVELPTPRSVGGDETEGLRDVRGGRDPRVTQGSAVAAAKEVLLATATGEDVPAGLIDALCDAVLGDPVVMMAMEAREEGPHRLMTALRLAGAVIQGAREREVAAVGSAGGGPLSG